MTNASNARVDRAARFHSSRAGPMMIQNAQPPLRSNDLLCGAFIKSLARREINIEKQRFRSRNIYL
ncbi:MAG TPA: hypothetical protein VIV66_12500 [Pyrinomonadaceae bacterium]